MHTTRPKQPGPWHVLARGDYRQPRNVVGPGGIAALAGLSADWQLPQEAPEAERRKALARWIADPKNPLTPRVIVNRLWAHHFGVGLVELQPIKAVLAPSETFTLAGRLIKPGRTSLLAYGPGEVQPRTVQLREDGAWEPLQLTAPAQPGRTR